MIMNPHQDRCVLRLDPPTEGLQAWLRTLGSALWPSLPYQHLRFYTYIYVRYKLIWLIIKGWKISRHSGGGVLIQIREFVLLVLSLEKYDLKFTISHA